ncbi:hypothetical protein PsorP6_007973 [Peronosclerospora sorghi]|uniref:Uncharacterized protein n=1 Tax=Peronosclerospora sorghi TaxID=230839 RepID=A0ACC0WCQ6_9STRA|nr:hypothetical protein PsorP6_007973 [Peronosclerospora sorghi]
MVSKTLVKPFPKSKHGQVKTDKPLQVIHSDVMGSFGSGGPFMDFKALMENQLEYNIKFAKICKSAGIVHQTTIPYSPQQNGLAERMNRTITERAKVIIFHMNVDKRWWAEAMNTAVFITNRLPSAAYTKKPPFQILFGQKTDISGMCVFGAKGYAHIDKSKRVRLEKKAFKCIFLGYADNVKGYRVWNIDLGSVMFTRSVTFDERPHSK